jgi:translation initiation factor IF-1
MTVSLTGGKMTRIQYAARIGAAALLVSTAAACSSGLGNVFGNVLGGSQDLSGTVSGVDSRSQQVFLQQSNGQTVGIGYDSRTQVVYQNQTYSVNSLERGDQITVRLTNSNNNGSNYYTDYIRVDQSANSSIGGGNTSGNVTTIQGNVQQVNLSQGWFTMRTNNGYNVTVSLPYGANRNDVNRFNGLRQGDFVRAYVVYYKTQRAELRNFY